MGLDGFGWVGWGWMGLDFFWTIALWDRQKAARDRKGEVGLEGLLFLLCVIFVNRGGKAAKRGGGFVSCLLVTSCFLR